MPSPTCSRMSATCSSMNFSTFSGLTEGAPADLFFFAHNLLSLGQKYFYGYCNVSHHHHFYGLCFLCMRILGKTALGELELSELVVSVLVADLASLPCRISAFR